MPAFSCETRDSTGRVIEKVVDAGSRREVIQILEEAGLFPIEIKEILDESRVKAVEPRRSEAPGIRVASKDARVDKRIKAKELMNFTMQLGGSIDAGVPILGALEGFAKQTKNDAFRTILFQVKADLEAGLPLSESLGMHPKAFPQVYASTVAAGEQSGTLGTVLDNLAEYIEADMEVRQDVRSALMYPAAVVATLGLAMIALMVFVVPRFTTFYSGFGSELPLPTRMLIGLSTAVTDYILFVAIAAVACGYAFAAWASGDAGRRTIERVLLKVPVLGHLLRTASTLRVVQMIGLFSQAGVPVLQGLETISTAVSSPKTRGELLDVTDSISAGETLSDSMEAADCLSPAARQMLAAGEASGSMERACFAVVRQFKKELRYLTKNLGTLIEPLLTVCLAGIVLFVALAVFLPMWDLVDVIGK